MPELPEVETVRRGLAPFMEGALIVSVDIGSLQLRFPYPPRFSEKLKGRRIIALSRRAKYLIAELDNGNLLTMHLGMSGSFRIAETLVETTPGDFLHPRSRDRAHDHVVFHLETMGQRKPSCRVIYNDPRRFGYMNLLSRAAFDVHPHFANLGIEPTGNALDAMALAACLVGKTAPLKAALLDQRNIAGLGNIYVCEALWQAGLSPRRSARTIVRSGGLPTARCELLVEAIRDVIARAIEAGGSSLRDHRRTDGTLGYFQHNFAVYDRTNQPCRRPGCEGTVSRIVQSGRSTFFCPVCQR